MAALDEDAFFVNHSMAVPIAMNDVAISPAIRLPHALPFRAIHRRNPHAIAHRAIDRFDPHAGRAVLVNRLVPWRTDVDVDPKIGLGMLVVIIVIAAPIIVAMVVTISAVPAIV